MVKHLPHISIEKYAAFLDGNLPDEEMKQMKAFIDNDADMQAVLEADGNIGGDLDLDLLESNPVSFEMDLPSIELPSLDAASPFEDNSIIEDFFSSDSDRSWEEMGSIINNGVNNLELMDETGEINGNLGIGNDQLDMAASENVHEIMPDTPYNWGIHDGDYGYLELGLPPIITQDDINNDIPTPFTEDL